MPSYTGRHSHPTTDGYLGVNPQYRKHSASLGARRRSPGNRQMRPDGTLWRELYAKSPDLKRWEHSAPFVKMKHRPEWAEKPKATKSRPARKSELPLGKTALESFLRS